MMWISYIYYLSKFSEFIDTFCFVARKKFGHISLLHVVHHGIMPLSVWPGVRWVPGGSATFFGLLNVFVHMFMYFYYMIAAMGPKYSVRISLLDCDLSDLNFARHSLYDDLIFLQPFLC